MISHKKYKEKLLENNNFKKEFEKTDLETKISLSVLEARLAKGLSQKELATKMKTTQSAISRLENGTALPSLSFLNRLATALNTKLIAPKFGFVEERKKVNYNSTSTSESLFGLVSTDDVRLAGKTITKSETKEFVSSDSSY